MKATDIRIDIEMMERRRSDTSFTEKSFLGFTKKYKQSEVREIWFNGIEHGMEHGLRMGSLKGQYIDIIGNFKNERQKEFYERFLKLADEYNCSIQYHPDHGMCVMDLGPGRTLSKEINL